MSGKKRILGLGASNHTLYERAKNDYYSTDPLAIQLLDKYNLLDHNPPRYVCPFVKRINCYRDDDQEFKKKASTICYAWFIWDKNYTGETTIRWLI